ncbi:hypothetical protein Glove_578g12 [Diversispora epigaea]|uniref:Uncharacterized protein n=1 Tax=Diversispora epigaea TaxID=1348612 RepID=A0A397GBS9_9GLOM|nr:hypothetical protein Glove_578g12 [Diversispora epigaea]
MKLFLSEYLEDTVISKSPHAINARKDLLWALIEDLIIIFDMEDLLSYLIFQEMKSLELNKTGYKKLIKCYPNGLERIQSIFRQKVLNIKIKNPTGRRALGVRKMKHKDYVTQNKENKRKNKESDNQLPELAQSSQISDQPVEQNQSNKKRKTLPHEKKILKRLLIYETKIPNHIYQEIKELLGVEWNKKRIYSWWSYQIKKSH